MPVEINGLLNHNVSSETHMLPFEIFDVDGIAPMARLHDEWDYDNVLVANAAMMPENLTIAGFISPTMAARMPATLDRLMSGRVDVNILTAASDEETKVDGDYRTKMERDDRTREYVGLCR